MILMSQSKKAKKVIKKPAKKVAKKRIAKKKVVRKKVKKKVVAPVVIKEEIKVEVKVEVKPFSHDELHEALLRVQDTMIRALVPFFLLGDTAKQVYEVDSPKLELDFIHVGVLNRHWTRSGSSTVKSLEPTIVETDKGMRFDFMGIPVAVDIIKGDYSFFEHPDKRFYYIDDLYLPNPMEEYLLVRDQIE